MTNVGDLFSTCLKWLRVLNWENFGNFFTILLNGVVAVGVLLHFWFVALGVLMLVV